MLFVVRQFSDTEVLHSSSHSQQINSS